MTEVENCHYTLEYMRLKTRIENMYEEASRITFEIPNDLYEAPEDDLETEEVPEDMYSKAKNIRVQILYDVQAEQRTTQKRRKIKCVRQTVPRKPDSLMMMRETMKWRVLQRDRDFNDHREVLLLIPDNPNFFFSAGVLR